MSSIFTQGPLGIVSLFIVLGLVVVVHELGHYLTGRAFGAAAESFSIGFGRPIYERKDKRNTRWRVNWIPFGGFVKFVGESQTAGDVGVVEDGPIGKKYMDLTVGQRSLVSVAGPLANFILAALIFALLAFNFGRNVEKITAREIVGAPAQAAGFEVGDIILAVDGKDVGRTSDVQRIVSLSTGTALSFTVDRDGEILMLDVVPVRGETDNGFGQTVSVGLIGLRMQRETVGRVEFGPVAALGEGARQTIETITTTGKMLGRLVTGREPITQLSGPVGIGDMTRRVVSSTLEQDAAPLSARLKSVGWMLLQISAFVSVGIGLVNLLPFPILDGGHLVFNAYEAVTGSVLPERIQEVALTFGAIFLLGFAVVITAGDIVKTGILQSFGG